MAFSDRAEQPSYWTRLKASLTPAEWRRIAAMGAVVAGLHVIGFFILIVLVVPDDLSLGGEGAFGMGVGLTAYVLGLRHAFDADHVAAIDNTTRKLISEGQRPLAAGFFFSLGHSTIVLALALLLAWGSDSLVGQVENDGSTLQSVAGTVGTTISGSFLMLIGILNLAVLVGIVKAVRRSRAGELDGPALGRALERRGPVGRLYGRVTGPVKATWQMYPVGALFGLGFDTATEVALLFLAAGAAFGGVPIYAVLCLPILFAAGMSLLDTIDGALMNVAYGWAFHKPVRKVFYNVVITGLSVAIALGVGTVELLAVLGEKLDLTGPVFGAAAAVDLNLLGYFVVAVFLATWACAVLAWRYGRIEERWSYRRSCRDPRP
jgi:nickel/cobalt transporter (NiCoT) family protein